jgi:hypothetical protein
MTIGFCKARTPGRAPMRALAAVKDERRSCEIGGKKCRGRAP